MFHDKANWSKEIDKNEHALLLKGRQNSAIFVTRPTLLCWWIKFCCNNRLTFLL
jgi:hypothetical protein